MGKKLDLSRLTDEEAKHVWEVVQRDFDLRKKEEERLEVLKTGSLEWYYEHVRARFKRFGSDKVMRSLQGRLRGSSGDSPEPGLPSRALSLQDGNGAAQLYRVASVGESAQTADEDAAGAAAGAAHLSREKRLLAVHPFDFEADSDYRAQSGPQALLSPPARSTLDSPQTLSDAPTAKEEEEDEEDEEEDAFPKDATSIAEACPSPESQDILENRGQSCPEVSLPLDAGLEGNCSPDRDAQPRLPCFADTNTSEEDAEKAHKMATHLPPPSKQRSRISSQESSASSESQIFEMNQRMLAIECLLARLEERIVVPREESFGPGPHTEADFEEEALKRKLGELASKISDQGASSEEEEEGQSGLNPGQSSVPDPWPSETQQASQTSGENNRPLGLEEQATHTRTPDSALSELEDRVALTATEVQHAKREVSDIESRIAALSAAGLPIKTWEKPKKKSNLQILPLQPTETSLEEEDPELSGATKAMSRPLVQRRIFNNSLKLQDTVDSPFSRKSDYRGSLTQRNPNGKTRRVDHLFAKPVMTHHP